MVYVHLVVNTINIDQATLVGTYYAYSSQLSFDPTQMPPFPCHVDVNLRKNDAP